MIVKKNVCIPDFILFSKRIGIMSWTLILYKQTQSDCGFMSEWWCCENGIKFKIYFLLQGTAEELGANAITVSCWCGMTSVMVICKLWCLTVLETHWSYFFCMKILEIYWKFTKSPGNFLV